jgi:hypothetical protein
VHLLLVRQLQQGQQQQQQQVTAFQGQKSRSH